MIRRYFKWAKQLADAGININDELIPPGFIFQEARERKIQLEFWQVCNAIWAVRQGHVRTR